VIGVGDLIAKWIPSWAVADTADCDCDTVRAEMNRLGPDGVEKNIDKYVQHFVDQKRHLRKHLQLAPDRVIAVWSELAIMNACNKVRNPDAVLPVLRKRDLRQTRT
jgi:hypothetical protein